MPQPTISLAFPVTQRITLFVPVCLNPSSYRHTSEVLWSCFDIGPGGTVMRDQPGNPRSFGVDDKPAARIAAR
jgi:hypothetical protein